MNNKVNKKYYLLGKKPILDALNANISGLLCLHLQKKDLEMQNLAKSKNIMIIVHCNDNFFMQFQKEANHQGYALEYKNNESFLKITDLVYLKNLLQKQKNPIILMLDEIMDMQNFGAILRTAYAANVQAVIFKKNNQAQINDYIIKTSMGFINKIPLIMVNNLSNAIEKLKNWGYWIFASTLCAQSIDYTKVDYNLPMVLIMGNEQKGVSALVQKNADFKIKIVMQNTIDSLNVSVATGILLFNIILLRNLNKQ